MAKTRETRKNAEILRELQNHGWFRNISDKYQVGIPDNIGSYRGLLFGIEVKAVGSVPKNGLAPAKKDHRFTKTQVKELERIQKEGGGVGLGFLICGDFLFWFSYDYINEDGQVDCHRLTKEMKFIKKEKGLGWDALGAVLSLIWAARMKELLHAVAATHAHHYPKDEEKKDEAN